MNPYSFIDPVADPKMFYGYQPELERIVKGVSAPGTSRQSFFVVGGGQMGKTSLLWQVDRRLQQLRNDTEALDQDMILIPIYLDLLSLFDFTRNGFFTFLCQSISRSLSNVSFPVPFPTDVIDELETASRQSDVHVALQAGLRRLITVVRPRQLRLVMLMDEFGRIIYKPEGVAISLNLRALLIHKDLRQALSYVIAGTWQDRQNLASEGSPLPNVMILEFLHVLNEKDSFALINEPTLGRLPTAVAHQVYQATGGHLFLTQYLMSVLCESHDIRSVKVEDVSRATERFFKERKDFEHWWKKLSEMDRRVYEVYQREPSTSHSVDELASMMLSVRSPTNSDRQTIAKRLDIEKSLLSLYTMGLVQETGERSYRLAGDMFAYWVRQIATDTD